MTQLITQRTSSDCVLAAIAMLVGRDFDELWSQADLDAVVASKGISSLDPWLERAGLAPKSWRFVRVWGDRMEVVKQLLWKRRALLSVHSLNIRNGQHMVMWDGDQVFDPSGLKTYGVDLHPMIITEIYVFDDAPQAATPPAA